MSQTADDDSTSEQEIPQVNLSTEVKTLELSSLLGARRMIRISHDGEIYTLRITKNNRVILTK